MKAGWGPNAAFKICHTKEGKGGQSKVSMETQNPDNDRAVVRIGPWQKSRVVAIQIGDGPGAHNDPGYRRPVYNAIVWAAGKK
jgi:hypothetical protein